MNNNTSNLFITVGAALALVFGVFMATPSQAHAFTPAQFLDPACFVLCSTSGSGGGHTTKVVNNYGNYKSPGGTVINNGFPTTIPVPSSPSPVTTAPVANNYYYTNYSAAPSSPTYAYNYNPAPVYTYGSTYSYNSQPVYEQNYVQPVYVQQYSPVYVSCSVSSSYATIGSSVTWSAYATGGNGYFSYSWNGSDGFYGNGQYAYFAYQYPGYKTASVTVYSNGQSYTQDCSSGVSVSAPIVYAQPIIQPIAQPIAVYPSGYQTSNYNGLDVGCYADPITASTNQPVTWNVEVTGGVGPYSYSWTGSDGLTGAASSVIKYYNSSGSKNAVVTVTSADGRNAVHACSNSVTVHSNTAPAPKPVVVQPAPVQQPQPTSGNGLSAAALFSLSSIPWGWVSVLVILLLFGTVLYLLFNKTKI